MSEKMRNINPTLFDVEFEMVNHPFWVTEKSDGVVLTGSQQALPDPTLITQTIFNSSHMQIRNDANTKNSLLRLFNNEIALDPTNDESGKWFKTEETHHFNVFKITISSFGS